MGLRAHKCLERMLALDFATILDIGRGDGRHADIFSSDGRAVTTIDIAPPADIIGDYNEVEIPGAPFDAIWASHVLEHQPDVHRFLTKTFLDLKDNGILAITVPPMKHAIVGGHLALWNAGLLLYNLIVAGFDCANASVLTYGYNISVIVRKKAATLPVLSRGKGDIETLAPFFPIPVHQGFDGRIERVNWPE